MSDSLFHDSPFIGDKVKLRAIELSDLPDIMKFWNIYEVRIGLGHKIPDSQDQVEEWIKKVTKENQEGTSYTFAIIEKQTEEFLGYCGLRRINKISRNASLGVAILNKEYHNKGYGTDIDGTIMAYQWRSSIDGELSQQSSFSKAIIFHHGKWSKYYPIEMNELANLIHEADMIASHTHFI